MTWLSSSKAARNYTPDEREVIDGHRTPAHAQVFLNSLAYFSSREDVVNSFRRALRQRKVNCLEGALTAAAILENYGHRPTVLDLVSSEKEEPDHVVFVFEHNSKLGAIGRSRYSRLQSRPPIYRSEEDLARSYYLAFRTANGYLHKFRVIDLDKIGRFDWRFSSHNLIGLDYYMQRMRHWIL